MMQRANRIAGIIALGLALVMGAGIAISLAGGSLLGIAWVGARIAGWIDEAVGEINGAWQIFVAAVLMIAAVILGVRARNLLGFAMLMYVVAGLFAFWGCYRLFLT